MNNRNKRQGPPAPLEEYAIILDYLSLGYVQTNRSKYKGNAIAQAIGRDYFTLFELTPKEGVDLEIQDAVFVGKGKKDKISRIAKLNFEYLTATSRIELDYAIRDVVESQEEKFVKFFNEAGGVSIKLHKLELIPGIGKKHMNAILDARKEKPFDSFADISERVPALTDPAGMIVNRIKQELDTTESKRGKKKYHIFTAVPRRPKQNNR
ncbi:MAG: DUF655 domain-containing protein [archaeon]|nr:DUF655 domain-containing protein [archaeon]